MSGVKRQWQAGGFAPADDPSVTKMPFRPCHQDVSFPIERHGPDPGQGFVVQIRYADVQAELVEMPLDFDGSLWSDDNIGAFVAAGKRTGHHGDDRQRHRDRTDPELTDHALAHVAQLLLKATIVRQNALRPREHALALLREADEALAALCDQDTETLLELLDARR
jgi:hypothetical protein